MKINPICASEKSLHNALKLQGGNGKEVASQELLQTSHSLNAAGSMQGSRGDRAESAEKRGLATGRGDAAAADTRELPRIPEFVKDPMGPGG